MYVKNVSNTNQQFKAGQTKFMLRPGSTAAMTDEEYGDHTTQLLLRRGVLAALEDEEGLDAIMAQEDEKKAKAEERKLEVNKIDKDTHKQVVMVRCAATKKDGERCLKEIAVPMAERDDDVPVFCGTHKNEKAEDYEKVEGTWVKKQTPAPEPEPVEEEQAEPAISEEEIAAALAEAEQEAE